MRNLDESINVACLCSVSQRASMSVADLYLLVISQITMNDENPYAGET